MTDKYPDNNPKTLVGAKKVPLHLVPPSAKHYLALALENGASKYGPYNWRDAKISISTYKAAAERHLDAFWDGEDVASDSGLHHIAHAMACCALILDAHSIGMLVDDRPAKGASPRLQEEFYKNKEVVGSKERLTNEEVVKDERTAKPVQEQWAAYVGDLRQRWGQWPLEFRS